MNFKDLLNAAISESDSLLCVGLDPQPHLMPDGVDTYEFTTRIIDATKDLVCAYKPNVAFYDNIQGCHDKRGGHEILDDIVAYIRREAPNVVIIGDSKRGDVADTAQIHAKVMFERFCFDAATINPLPGLEGGVDAFLDYSEKGVFVWSRSSNPGAADLFDLWVSPSKDAADGEQVQLYEYISILASKWNELNNNVGIVAVATYPQQLKRQRELCPDMPFLIPAVGMQQGDLLSAVNYGTDQAGLSATINASRSILYGTDRDAKNFAEKARIAAQNLRGHINEQREFSTKEPVPTA